MSSIIHITISFVVWVITTNRWSWAYLGIFIFWLLPEVKTPNLYVLDNLHSHSPKYSDIFFRTKCPVTHEHPILLVVIDISKYYLVKYIVVIQWNINLVLDIFH